MAPAIGPGIGVAYLRGPLGPAVPPPPATVPAMMSAPVVTAGNSSATVDRADNTGNGGSPITRYLIRHSIDAMMMPATTIEQTTDPQTVNGLTNGVLHYFQTAAENAVGQGPWSDTASVTPLAPATAPAKMAAPVLTAGDGSIAVDRANSTANGGSAITRYDLRYATAASMAGATTVEQTADPQTVSGLTNGTAYCVQTRAVNAVGAGEWSDAASATPVAASAVFTDDFTGDGLLGARTGWTFAFGSSDAATTSGGKLNAVRSSPDSGWYAPDTGSLNHYAQAMLETVGTNGPLICVDVQDTDNWVGVRNSASNYSVLKKVNGSVTVVITISMTPAVGDVVRLELRGRDLTLLINGAVAWTGALAAGELATETRPGIVVRTATRSPWIDNWRSDKL